MNKEKKLLILLSLSVLVASLHLKALELKLYFIYPWFDILLHFLGGVVISVIAFIIFLYIRGGKDILYNKKILFLIPVMVLLVGVFWEFFELWAGVAPAENYILDTSIDLAMDLVGGVFVSLLILVEKRRK